MLPCGTSGGSRWPPTQTVEKTFVFAYDILAPLGLLTDAGRSEIARSSPCCTIESLSFHVSLISVHDRGGPSSGLWSSHLMNKIACGDACLSKLPNVIINY
jgi:hypothetical protein